MTYFANALNWLLVLLGVGGFLWSAVGIPTGIVWLIVFTRSKKKNIDFPVHNWLWVTMGGMGLVLLAFALYAVFAVIFPNFGVTIFPPI